MNAKLDWIQIVVLSTLVLSILATVVFLIETRLENRRIKRTKEELEKFNNKQ